MKGVVVGVCVVFIASTSIFVKSSPVLAEEPVEPGRRAAQSLAQRRAPALHGRQAARGAVRGGAREPLRRARIRRARGGHPTLARRQGRVDRGENGAHLAAYRAQPNTGAVFA